MLALHGTWVLRDSPSSSSFAWWAETTERSSSRTSPTSGQGAPRHPFAVGPKRLVEATGALCGRSFVDPVPQSEVVGQLPSAGTRPLQSPGLASVLTSPSDQGPVVLASWRIPVLSYDPGRAVELLLALASVEPSMDVQVADDLRFWTAAARFALDLLARQRLLPGIEQERDASLGRWRALLDDEHDRRRFDLLVAAMPAACRALSWEPGTVPPAPPGPPGPRLLLRRFLDATVDAVARSARGGRVAASVTSTSPALAWWRALSGSPLVELPQSEARAYAGQLSAWQPAGQGQGAESFRVCFRLSPPLAAPADSTTPCTGISPLRAREGSGGEVRSPWTVEYLLQAQDDPSLLVPADAVWRQRGDTARFLKRRLESPQERLLAGLGRAARHVPAVEASLQQARPEACALSTSEAHQFLKEQALVLRAAGFGVLVPGLESRLRLRVRLKSPATPGQSGSSPASPAGFGWDTVVQYDWQVALGGETLSREEFLQLARLKEPLVQVRGQWVELDERQLEQALAFLERPPGEDELALPDALRLALAPDDRAGLPIEGVDAEGWVDDLLRDLRLGPRRERLKEPPGFAGTLRPYQRAGVSWLAMLDRYAIGACLADDMGLGKTIQVIALLLHDRAAREPQRAGTGTRRRGETPSPTAKPTLLICPTSVVGNWQRELARFGPSLRVLVHHGAARVREGFAVEAGRHDVVISTYALLHRDEEILRAVEWERVILDEAQNVKNAATKAAQAARALPARWRAALTGTPVENRLTELWSIFQFLNPGYLGSEREFRRRFASPIERAGDATATARLKALVAPFILRRLKTDKRIIQDLPEKQEMKVFCPLTPEQATLYEAVVRDSLRQIEESEGIQRRGLILATLTRLKQVCNHPALFLHDKSALVGAASAASGPRGGRGAGSRGSRSGKLTRLGEMLEEAFAVDDRALIFTQYAEMGRMLKAHLEETFGGEALFLHGGTPAAERDRLVARFQRDDRRAPRLFILSIKAGGTGLTLTRANHVFHFDRWWNPAVENQATDRAFRIGQTRNVQVHTFICSGTFEEALDQLIERKVALAESITGTSESWITELTTTELRDLFALRRADVMAAA